MSNLIQVISWQSKDVYEYLQTHNTFYSTQTRENKFKYKPVQKALELNEDQYPIWLFRPSDVTYLVKGRLFRNENFISMYDLDKYLYTEFLFHMSIDLISLRIQKEFYSEYYLYEFTIDRDFISDDLLEGYSICGVIPFVTKSMLKAVYKPEVLCESKEEFYKAPHVKLTPIYVADDSVMSKEAFICGTCENRKPHQDKNLIEENYQRQLQYFNLCLAE